MFRTPFRPWVESSPLRNANGDNRPLRFLNEENDADEEERKANRKHAWFFATVALLFVLANLLSHVRDAADSSGSSVSGASVTLTLSPTQETGNPSEFAVQFRLSNKGNHSVFYPVRPGTSALIGQIVVRTSPSSDWTTSPNASKQEVPAVQESVGQALAWIEMPPGGWVDGEFRDTGEFPGEHAYAIFLKPARDVAMTRIVSKSYTSPAN